MSITADKNLPNASVTWTGNVADIFALAGVSAAEKRRLVIRRAADELALAANATGLTDAEIDAQVAAEKAAVEARAAALKASRTTGSL